MKHRFDMRTKFITTPAGQKAWRCLRCGVWSPKEFQNRDYCDGVAGQRQRERIHRLLATKFNQVLPEVWKEESK